MPESWSNVFVLQTPLLELVVRGIFLYLGILLLMRIMPRRSGGEMALMDLIFALLVVSAASPAFGNYTSVTDGLVLVAATMGCNYAMNALSFRVRLIERLISPAPLPVIRDGRLLRRNLRREFLTEEEILTCLRERDIEDVADVKVAYVEGDGSISVIRRHQRTRS